MKAVKETVPATPVPQHDLSDCQAAIKSCENAQADFLSKSIQQ